MEDNTASFTKPSEAAPETAKPQSKIFNTSVRGWIALIMTVCLVAAILLIVVAPYYGVTIPDRLGDQFIVLFCTAFGGAISSYFNFNSKEGQSLIQK